MVATNAQEQTAGRVLVLDDEKNIVTVLKAILEKRGFLVSGFAEPAAALDALRRDYFHAVVTDLHMPEMDGMAFLAETHRLKPELPVVMITAFGTVDSAVDAIKRGAFDYVTKPFEQSEIALVVQKAVNTYRLKELELQKTEELSQSPLVNGRGPAIQNVQKLIKRVAPTPSTVLIQGEAGTGKDIIAEEIHKLSERAGHPLVKVNCSAVTPAFLEQELFGTSAKLGRIQQAHQGSLFLDEISEMNPEAQFRLLNFLEEDARDYNVRVIAASHKDLAAEVAAGHFRADLFYKLGVFPIQVPPLRERRDDFSDIVQFLVRRVDRRLQRGIPGAAPDCVEALAKFPWPGNLRQLEQVLERMMLLCEEGELRARDIPRDVRSGPTDETPNFRDIVRRQTQTLERDLIARALQEMEGNVTRTAERLGLSRKGLQLKMKELGIKNE